MGTRRFALLRPGLWGRKVRADITGSLVSSHDHVLIPNSQNIGISTSDARCIVQSERIMNGMLRTYYKFGPKYVLHRDTNETLNYNAASRSSSPCIASILTQYGHIPHTQTCVDIPIWTIHHPFPVRARDRRLVKQLCGNLKAQFAMHRLRMIAVPFLMSE